MRLKGKTAMITAGPRSGHGQVWVSDPLTDRVRRNCAVGAHSEWTLVDERGEAGEQLPLPRAPVRRPTHHDVELLGERRPEELGPVEQGLHDAERFRAAALADRAEHRRL